MRIRIDPAVAHANFTRFKDNPSLRESARLLAAGKRPVEMIQALAMNPGVLRAFAGFADVYPGGSLERPICEKVILRVSQLHECQFCVHSHLDMMSQLGIPSDLTPAAPHTPRERAAIEYAELMTHDANRIPDEFFGRLRDLFTEPEIVELTFLVGLITMLNRFNNALQIRYGQEYREVRVEA
jgi:alkylhydroperoxidase family enzyme